MHGRRVFLIAAPLVALLWPRPAGAITDARDVGADEYRSVGAIVARSTNGECGHEYVCTATLITSDTILTAGHCGVRVGEEVPQDWEWFFTLDPAPGLLPMLVLLGIGGLSCRRR